MRPKIFIGSSNEAIDIADAISSHLMADAECTVWKDNVFGPSTYALPSLLRQAKISDFAIFVFSPDDYTTMRGISNQTIRDNVLFEMGIFIGQLGVERCFCVTPLKTQNLRLPSDLTGLMRAAYDGNREDQNWRAAVRPACSEIKTKIREIIPQSNPNLAPNIPMTAEYYGKGVLVKGVAGAQIDLVASIGSWNEKLDGFIVPGKRDEDLKKLFPRLNISGVKFRRTAI